VADLKATAAVGGLPVTQARATLENLDLGRVSSVAPFPGQDVTPMLDALGLTFPQPGTTITSGSARIVWTGRDQAFLIGTEPPAQLANVAAVTDQSDAWAWFHLTGEDARDVLARLTPLDLRDNSFAVGGVARSTMNHMQAILIRPAPHAYEIAVFRSMAGTLVHELTDAMRAVAVRAGAKKT